MNKTPSGSQAALRRLIIVIGAVAALVIFSYGWTVTDIDLAVPQQPVRQQNVGNALRELLSPNVFTQDYDIQTTTTQFAIDCVEDPAAAEPAASDQPYIVVTPACGSSGEIVTVEGYNFYPDSLARINWIATDGDRRIRQTRETNADNFVTHDNGTFSVQIEVPRIRGSAGEIHTVEAQGAFPQGSPHISNTTTTVLEKMVETIFLALIATVISIPPAAALSFFAARNLMRPVRIPLGNLLISIVLLPIGWLVGSALLGQLGLLALRLTNGEGFAGTAAIFVFGFASVASARRLRSSDEASNGRLRGIVNSVIVAVAIVLITGVLGGLGQLLDRTINDGILGYVATFFGALGDLAELMLVAVGGLVGAFTLSSIGGTLTRDALKHISVAFSHISGAVLGALAGAIVLGVTAVVGGVAAWLGLLTPVIAASLAAPILPMIYRRLAGGSPIPGRSERSVVAALSLAGSIIVFALTFSVLSVGRALIEGTLPSQAAALSIGDVIITQYVGRAMLIGAAIGGISGALAGTKSNFPIGDALYTATRTILNALRSIEPLIMGIVFVIWVGIGPFAGVLALALHSIASLGKLYSEQIESIDSGPIEALQSTGANRLQTIVYAVVPQIIPPYISFTMYRWDINVRMSTIIGFVGGGGIGFLLQQQINLLRYRDAGVAVLAIAIVVSVLDYASAAIRERYT